MMPPITNLQRLKRSVHKPVPGDIFVVRIPDGRHLFGRVVLIDAWPAPMPGSNLLYVYRWMSDSDVPDYSKLTPNNLLIPPVWTNRRGWTMGVFLTVDHRPLSRFDLLRTHCFWDAVPQFGVRYRNERGEPLPKRSEPCGTWGLASYLRIDDEISTALGIPLAPDSDR